MPWQETNPVLERHHFAHDLASGHWSMTALCDRDGISRNTGYKWLHRYEQEGPRGRLGRSRAPRSSPSKTPAAVVALILEEHTLGRFDERTHRITGAPSLKDTC